MKQFFTITATALLLLNTYSFTALCSVEKAIERSNPKCISDTTQEGSPFPEFSELLKAINPNEIPAMDNMPSTMSIAKGSAKETEFFGAYDYVYDRDQNKFIRMDYILAFIKSPTVLEGEKYDLEAVLMGKVVDCSFTEAQSLVIDGKPGTLIICQSGDVYYFYSEEKNSFVVFTSNKKSIFYGGPKRP